MKGRSQFGSFLVIAGIAIVVGYFMLKPSGELRIFQPSDVNPALVDEDVRENEDHHILDFKLINQLGDTVTNSDVKGKILVVNFFFARCTTICPKISANISKTQKYFSDDSTIHFLSHSVTPQIDSVAVLRNYAETFEVNPDRWWLLTGEKSHIYKLARRSYFAVLDEGDGGLQDFIHTENVVLIDPDGRLRGYYDGTSNEDISRLISEIGVLQIECFEEE